MRVSSSVVECLSTAQHISGTGFVFYYLKKSKIKLLIIGNNHPLWVAPFPGQIPGLCKRKGNELNTNMNTIILCSQYFTVHAMRQLFEAPTTLPSLE